MSETAVMETDREWDSMGISTGDFPEHDDVSRDMVKDIDESIEEAYRQMEADYQEQIRNDWMKFRCHAVEPEFSRASYDISNYTGELYTKARCEKEARSVLRGIYNEARTERDTERLYCSAVEEIMRFIDGAFEGEKQSRRSSLSEAEYAELERVLDVADFRDEIKGRLKTISVPRVKDFSHYLSMVEYDSVYGGDEGILGGFLNKAGKNWSFNGYAAYHALSRDFVTCARKYADRATEATRTALNKRIAAKEELIKEKSTYKGGNGNGCI